MKKLKHNLILTNKNKVLIGDYTIKGDVIIKNSELIVFGSLNINGNVIIENSEIIVSNTLKISTKYASISKISIISTDISVGTLLLFNDFDNLKNIFSIKGGDIFIAEDLWSDIEISSDREITVLGDLDANKQISCLSLFVRGFTDCHDINATLDIYSLHGIDSTNLFARDIFTEDCINCNGNGIHVYDSIHATKGIINCSSFTVGI